MCTVHVIVLSVLQIIFVMIIIMIHESLSQFRSRSSMQGYLEDLTLVCVVQFLPRQYIYTKYS